MTTKPNTIAESTDSQVVHLELVSDTPTLAAAVSALDAIKDTILHDQPIYFDQVHQLTSALKNVNVYVEDMQIPIFELLKIPDLKRNVEIWTEIKNNF